MQHYYERPLQAPAANCSTALQAHLYPEAAPAQPLIIPCRGCHALPCREASAHTSRVQGKAQEDSTHAFHALACQAACVGAVPCAHALLVSPPSSLLSLCAGLLLREHQPIRALLACLEALVDGGQDHVQLGAGDLAQELAVAVEPACSHATPLPSSPR